MESIDLISVPGNLGPYRLVSRLGFGGTSQVFLAHYFGASGFEKRVAIKTLLPQFLGNPDFERLFIREAVLGANLVHQNLVQVHDFGVHDGIQYMRIDWVDGSNLAELIAKERLSLAHALFVATEIARALEHLHAATDHEGRPLGLVHRDLKPSNILVSQAGEVRLGDFGILKATGLADITRGQVRRGSYCYMSPEQVRGERLTPASDQFALGSILYQLSTGSLPFEAATVSEVCDLIATAKPPDLAAVPDAIRKLVERLLAPKPADRYPSSSDLRRELQTLAAQHRFIAGDAP